MKKLFGRAAALLAAAVIAVGMPSVTVKATEATTVAAEAENAEATTVAEEAVEATEATEATTEASTEEAQADTVEDTDVGDDNADAASSDPDFIAGDDVAVTTGEESSSGISKVAVEIICLGVIALIGVVIIVKKT
ncbi:MAG: hypothetical protein K6F97_08325 [Lachnospiraceae bacterium]|nr:hypothetical protein [Lachnospiraceae bacterium]